MKKGDAKNKINKTPVREQALKSTNMQGNDRQNNIAAHDQAEKDMTEDPDLAALSPNDDLDEGESARLGEEKTDMI